MPVPVPVIYRPHQLSQDQDPCYHPNLGYEAILAYHCISLEERNAMVAAYFDNTDLLKPVPFAQDYFEDAMRDADCVHQLLVVETEPGSTMVHVRVEHENNKQDARSDYSISLIRGILAKLAEYGVRSEFEFIQGKAMYRIGGVESGPHCSFILKINYGPGGIGYYDVSIPPDNRKSE